MIFNRKTPVTHLDLDQFRAELAPFNERQTSLKSQEEELIARYSTGVTERRQLYGFEDGMDAIHQEIALTKRDQDHLLKKIDAASAELARQALTHL